MAEQSSIQVVVRLRPMSERELKGNALPVVTASTEKKEVTVIKGSGARTLRSTFAFDDVFTSFSTQKEVFDQTLAPVIGDVSFCSSQRSMAARSYDVPSHSVTGSDISWHETGHFNSSGGSAVAGVAGAGSATVGAGGGGGVYALDVALS